MPRRRRGTRTSSRGSATSTRTAAPSSSPRESSGRGIGAASRASRSSCSSRARSPSSRSALPGGERVPPRPPDPARPHELELPAVLAQPQHRPGRRHWHAHAGRPPGRAPHRRAPVPRAPPRRPLLRPCPAGSRPTMPTSGFGRCGRAAARRCRCTEHRRPRYRPTSSTPWRGRSRRRRPRRTLAGCRSCASGSFRSAATGRPVQADRELVVTNGAMHALGLVFRSLLGPGDEVVVPAPCFFFEGPIRSAGGVPVYVTASFEDVWMWDADAIERAVGTRTRALLICNPGNPTGAVPAAQEVAAAAEVAKRHDLVLVTDEAYEASLWDTSLASAFPLAERALLVRSLGKSLSLPHLRLGLVAGPEELVDGVAAALEWDVLRVGLAPQAAALAALDGPRGWLEDVHLRLAEDGSPRSRLPSGPASASSRRAVARSSSSRTAVPSSRARSSRPGSRRWTGAISRRRAGRGCRSAAPRPPRRRSTPHSRAGPRRGDVRRLGVPRRTLAITAATASRPLASGSRRERSRRTSDTSSRSWGSRRTRRSTAASTRSSSTSGPSYVGGSPVVAPEALERREVDPRRADELVDRDRLHVCVRSLAAWAVVDGRDPTHGLEDGPVRDHLDPGRLERLPGYLLVAGGERARQRVVGVDRVGVADELQLTSIMQPDSAAIGATSASYSPCTVASVFPGAHRRVPTRRHVAGCRL